MIRSIPRILSVSSVVNFVKGKFYVSYTVELQGGEVAVWAKPADTADEADAMYKMLLTQVA